VNKVFEQNKAKVKVKTVALQQQQAKNLKHNDKTFFPL
jgi:hypothetical protein